jgi:hypothetical protein
MPEPPPKGATNGSGASDGDGPAPLDRRNTSSLNSRFQVEGLQKLSNKKRQRTLDNLQRYHGWELNGRGPYHEYVHGLYQAGWTNLKELDEYLCQDYEDRNLTISILDFTDTEIKRYDDLHDDLQLQKFISQTDYEGVKCRLYLAEQKGNLASSVMETLGSNLKLDPRWLQWHVKGSKQLMSPAARHRAPYTALAFRLLDPDGFSKTDTESFRVSLYVQPHENGKSWTGMYFMS